MLQLRFCTPLYLSGEALTHITASLCRYMNSTGVSTSIVSAGHAATLESYLRVTNRSKLMYRAMYKFGRDTRAVTERQFLKQVRDGDVCYLWPGCSLELTRALKRRGNPIVHERINCHTATAKAILDAEYEREGFPPAHDIADGDAEKESAELDMGDAIFSPSPLVTQSLVNAGVSRDVILPASYGWDPSRVLTHVNDNDTTRPVRVLFLGRGCLRKGLHLLLRAWAELNARAELWIVGTIDTEIQERFAHQLSRRDVKVFGHVKNVAQVLADCDVFAFPSLEEGSPLVSYEAAAAGLASVVSPMAAGEILRGGEDALIVDPHDAALLTQSLRRLIDDAEYRRQLGRNAVARAADFTWDKVAARRSAQLVERFAKAMPRFEAAQSI